MTSATFTSETRLHPLTAIRAVGRLVADPEDTRQIFVILRALRGRSGQKAWARFAASATGARILAERRDLLTSLSDRASLAALPAGSVGRAYHDFMAREQLSADGLVQASQDGESGKIAPNLALFRNRMRDAHDLTHVLTGYGRDPLGELCLLAFMHQHSRNLGQALIVAMSWPRLPRAGRAAIRQAWRNGKAAHWFMSLDYEALLARPLDEVRREIGIAAPTLYQGITP